MRVISLLLLSCLSCSVHADMLSQTDRLMGEKIALEKAKVELQQNWQTQQAQLQQLLRQYALEQQALSEKLAESKLTQAKQSDQRQKLLAEQTTLELQAQKYQALLLLAKAQLAQIWPLLPPPLVQAQQHNYQILQQQQVGLTEQITALVELLSAINQFNHLIHFEHQQIELAGKAWQVEVLYVGLAQAYFRSADGSQVGMGFADKEQWQWQLVDAERAQIQQAFAVYLQQQPLQLLNLPVREIGQ